MGRTVEVDEEQLLQDQRLRNVLTNIMRHPKAKLLAQEAHKMVDPNAPTPDLDAAKAQIEPMQAIDKKLNDFLEAQKKESADRIENERVAKLNAGFEAGRAHLRSEKWTDDGIKKLEEFMEQKGIIDHEIAAAAFTKLHPPQDPVMPGGTGSWNFLEVPTDDTADYVKKLIESKGESNSLVERAAHEAINEVRRSTRR